MTAQLFDLGYELNDYKTSIDLQTVFEQLDEQMNFVMLMEYLDESLVLLQRMLCWNLRDMVYLKKLAVTNGDHNMIERKEIKVKEFSLFRFSFKLLYTKLNFLKSFVRYGCLKDVSKTSFVNL